MRPAERHKLLTIVCVMIQEVVGGPHKAARFGVLVRTWGEDEAEAGALHGEMWDTVRKLIMGVTVHGVICTI